MEKEIILLGRGQRSVLRKEENSKMNFQIDESKYTEILARLDKEFGLKEEEVTFISAVRITSKRKLNRYCMVSNIDGSIINIEL